MSALGTRDGRALSADDRYELATAAQSAERRNRPRHLVIVALAVLVVGLAMLLAGVVKRGAAASSTARQQAQLERIGALASEIIARRELEAERSEGGGEGQIRDSRVRELAVRAGMSAEPPLANVRADPDANGVRRRYRYTVRDDALAPMLEWVRLILTEYRGAWVHEITIKPVARQWSLEVVIARWEQTG